MKKLIFIPDKKVKINYYGSKKVFDPTITSNLIIKAILKKKKFFLKNKKILDLGCGTGVLGISIKKIFKKNEVSLSDISNDAVKLCKKNVKLNKLNCNVKKSDLLNDWSGEKFNVIVNDVSAISSFFKTKNFWYNKSIPCDTGIQGIKNNLKILKIASNYCKFLLMPIISLSNVTLFKNFLKKEKFNYEVLLKEYWPLPKNLVKNNFIELAKLKKKKQIDFDIKFGMHIAYTEVILIKL